jgi:predicted phosphoribosyltransferase
MRFDDRIEAGTLLAKALKKFQGERDLIVLALPRGGVPVAYHVAKALHAPLDVFVVRKLGVPNNEEFAMGAIASGGVRVLMTDTIRQLGISQATIDAISSRESKEVLRREALYRGTRPAVEIAGKKVILVDDGIATGSTMLAAVRALRKAQPKMLIVAVPVAPKDTLDKLEREADQVVCLYTPDPFWGVGTWYQDFSQTSDGEVRELLAALSMEKTAENSLDSSNP